MIGERIDDIRHRSCCLRLLRYVDESELRGRAAKYGLEDEIDALLQYRETPDIEDD